METGAVITGIGVMTAAGIGKQNFWQGLLSGQSFLTPITRFDTTRFTSSIAGTINNFEARAYLDPRIIAQTDRWTHFDLICAQEALTDAGLSLQDEDPTRIGCVFAAGTGGNEYGQKQLHICWADGPEYVSAYQSIAWFYAASIGQVSIRNKLRGYGRNICAEAAGGLLALAHAAKLVTQGVCDTVIVGGSEAPVAPYIFACHQASGIISPDTSPNAYRPFDVSRSGPIIGEGGAVFCIESKEHAARRQAHIYGEITGWGQTFDGTYSREPAEDGQEYGRALSMALQSGRLDHTQIDWVICDGLGTQSGDVSESRALQAVFGSHLAELPCSAPKSMIGRLFNGASTVDAATALLALQEQVVLPTVGHQRPDPRCAIDCVPNQPRAQKLRHIMIGARGYGGFNAALVLSQPA